MLTGVRPVYMTPTRNAYGIIGPIPKKQMQPEAIQAKIKESKFAIEASNQRPVYSVVTNCTYDGLIYNGDTIQDLLGQSCDRIHYDEAWFGYSRFNPIYKGFHAMRGDKSEHTKDQPTIFATHSTHKLLNALSQASYIHIREGKGNIKEAQFSQAYMMHATTSPLYSIAASNDVAAAMMDGKQGINLTTEVIGVSSVLASVRCSIIPAHLAKAKNISPAYLVQTALILWLSERPAQTEPLCRRAVLIMISPSVTAIATSPLSKA